MSAPPITVLLAILAALLQGAITLLWYRPPVAPDGRQPRPLMEAALFTVAFGLVFVGYSVLLDVVSDVSPPLTEYLLLGVSLGGWYAVVAVWGGRWTDEATPAQRRLSMVATVVFALFPLLVLIA